MGWLFLLNVADADPHLPEFPIVDETGRLRGMLTRDAMIKALKERGPDTPALEAMQAEVPTVSARAKLDTAKSVP